MSDCDNERFKKLAIRHFAAMGHDRFGYDVELTDTHIEKLEGIAHRLKGENMAIAKANERLQQYLDTAEACIEELEADKLDLLRDLSISIERNEELEGDVLHERWQHYETCESKGLEWYGDIPEPPEDKKGIKQTLAAGVYVSGNGKTGD